MITWNDFILDDFFGPMLKLDDRLTCTIGGSGGGTKSFTEETHDSSRHQDDGTSTQKNQETEQMQRLARMVGHTSSAVESHMEVNSDESRKISSVIGKGEA